MVVERGGRMKVCFMKTDVTPIRPCRMGGYERKKKSEGVLDPIQVNYMGMEVQKKPILLAMIDCICLDKNFVLDVKQEVSKRTGLHKNQIIISCIHTHSAPCFFKLTFENVPAETELTIQLKEKIIEDLGECFHRMTPCTLNYETCMIEDLYGNRNRKEAWSDKSFHVLKFYQEDDLIGCFVNISTHPTLLGGNNHLLSADLLGHIRNQLENEVKAPVLISNGTCGDVSTRFYRNDHEDLDTCAHAILQQFHAKKQQIKLQMNRCEMYTVDQTSVSDFTKDPVHQQIKANLLEQDSPMNDLFLHKCEIKESFGRFSLNLHADIIAYDDLIFITLPGDILSEFGRRIKDSFPDKIVILICYSGGYCNYFVPQEEYGKYFETFNSRLQIGESDRFIQKIIDTAKSNIYIDKKVEISYHEIR